MDIIMIESQQCIELIKSMEGFKSTPYKCSANIPTIGYGTTKYPNGNLVVMTDAAITEIQASEYLQWYVNICANKLSQCITVELSQCQFDALCSFAYNIGVNSFINSTLIKIVNNDPNDVLNIEAQFMRWVYAKGRLINGLVNRRKAEYKLYSQTNLF
jgi:lysozyme